MFQIVESAMLGHRERELKQRKKKDPLLYSGHEQMLRKSHLN